TQALGLVGMHEHARLLQEDRAAQARGQDEMAFEDGAGLAEDSQHFVRVHVVSPMRGRQPLTRLAALTLELSLSCESSRFRCFRSQTSRSKTISVKSGAVRAMVSVWMLASLAAMVWA